MDGADDVGPRQDQEVAVALQLARMAPEPLAAEVLPPSAVYRWIIVPIAPSSRRMREDN